MVTFSIYSQGGSGAGGSGPPGVILSRAFDRSLNQRFVRDFRLTPKSDLQRLMETSEDGLGNLIGNKIWKKEPDYVAVGEVLDLKLEGEESESDLQSVLDSKPDWLLVIDDEVLIREDAPVENYQTTSGEIFDFK